MKLKLVKTFGRGSVLARRIAGFALRWFAYTLSNTPAALRIHVRWLASVAFFATLISVGLWLVAAHWVENLDGSDSPVRRVELAKAAAVAAGLFFLFLAGPLWIRPLRPLRPILVPLFLVLVLATVLGGFILADVQTSSNSLATPYSIALLAAAISVLTASVKWAFDMMGKARDHSSHLSRENADRLNRMVSGYYSALLRRASDARAVLVQLYNVNDVPDRIAVEPAHTAACERSALHIALFMLEERRLYRKWGTLLLSSYEKERRVSRLLSVFHQLVGLSPEGAAAITDAAQMRYAPKPAQDKTPTQIRLAPEATLVLAHNASELSPVPITKNVGSDVDSPEADAIDLIPETESQPMPRETERPLPNADLALFKRQAREHPIVGHAVSVMRHRLGNPRVLVGLITALEELQNELSGAINDVYHEWYEDWRPLRKSMPTIDAERQLRRHWRGILRSIENLVVALDDYPRDIASDLDGLRRQITLSLKSKDPRSTFALYEDELVDVLDDLQLRFRLQRGELKEPVKELLESLDEGKESGRRFPIPWIAAKHTKSRAAVSADSLEPSRFGRKSPLEEQYLPLINEFLESLSTHDRVKDLGSAAWRFLQAPLEVRGPWNVVDPRLRIGARRAKSMVTAASLLHGQGRVRPFGVRLTPRHKPEITRAIESGKDWPETPLRKIHSEVVVCCDADTGWIPREKHILVTEVVMSRDNGNADSQMRAQLARFVELQLRGYGFQEPTPRDINGLTDMYLRQLEESSGRLRFFLADLPARTGQTIGAGALTVLSDPRSRTIGLFGLAVAPQARNRGVGRTLIGEVIERARLAADMRDNDPRPPLVFALCDFGQENERVYLDLGFRRAEIRPIYAGVPDWEVRERARLRSSAWHMPPTHFN